MKKTPLLRNDLFLREGLPTTRLLCDRKAEKSTIKSSSKKKKFFLHACVKKKKKISLAVLPHIFTQINALVKVTNS